MDTSLPNQASSVPAERIPRITSSEAAACLKQGGVVAIPTETVYGLAAHARNLDAITQVFHIKGRPESHPVIVHVAQPCQISDWACEIPEATWELADAFWPGPLTLILKRHPNTPLVITGGQDTVAIRVPRHPIALDILSQLGDAVIAPSANRFGHISPTTPEHVESSFREQACLIQGLVAGGACRVGIESTILDLSHLSQSGTLVAHSSEPALIRRPGQISLTDLRRILSHVEAVAPAPSPAIRVPGNLDSHYAPTHPTYLIASDDLTKHILPNNLKTGFLGWSSPPEGCYKALTLPPTPDEAANSLYAMLHELDTSCDLIWVEALVSSPGQNPSPEWAGVWDRLLRATAGEYIPSDPSFLSLT